VSARPALRCTYCHDELERRGAVFCATCLAPHHAGCQDEHGHCAAPGCHERDVVRRERVRQWHSSAFLAGLSGVALGTAILTAALGIGELLTADTAPESAPEAPSASARGPGEVLLVTNTITHSLFVGPGERLVFLGGPISGIEVKRVDARAVATSVLLLSPDEGLTVRVDSAAGSTYVPPGACPVVLGFFDGAVFGGTRHALASETDEREREESP
jgi:hypothetical protein